MAIRQGLRATWMAFKNVAADLKPSADEARGRGRIWVAATRREIWKCSRLDEQEFGVFAWEDASATNLLLGGGVRIYYRLR